MQGQSKIVLDSDAVVGALDRVVSSKAFAGADRLKEFLRYIVQESIAGRGDKIRGKNIAQDVYGRKSQKDISTANVVRVDAGRLRRRLEVYYSDEGAKDPLRIQVAKGGYTPQFEVAQSQENETKPKKSYVRRYFIGAGAFGLLAIAAITLWISVNDPNKVPKNSQSDSRQNAERAALFEESPTALQARNLAEEARGLLFPATQPTRLLAALTLFEKAIELNPDYFGGYAGAAQAAAMFGGLAPDGPDRDQMFEQARQYAEEASRLAPAEGWSQSAMAFLLMFERDFDDANRLSKRAVSLDPDDLITLEIDAIIAFFSGDFERAIANSDPGLHLNRRGSRFPWRNVLGNASFYTGNYNEAAKHLMEAAASGGPVSEINTAHLIAALQATGRTREAQKLVKEYNEAWPDSRIEELMLRLFQNPQDAEKLIAQMRQAGWVP